MSFGGFTNFAKSALLTAQKHIDSALHIEEEDEDEEEGEEEQKDGWEDGDETERGEDEQQDREGDDGERSIYKSTIQDKEPTSFEPVSHPEQPGRSQQPSSDFLDVDLNGPSPPESHWGLEPVDDVMQCVVDTEPNPIRDAHGEPDPEFHCSPPSSVNDHSPDDEESSQNGQSSSTAAPASTATDFSLVNLAKDQELDDDAASKRSTERGGPPSEKTLDKFEDVRTVASSDIEVIRPMDDGWSVTSSQQNVQQPGTSSKSAMAAASIGMLASTSLKELQQSQTTAELLEKLNGIGGGDQQPPQQSQQQPDLQEQIALLTAKLKHRDQRIEELGRLNENLKATNVNLAAKNKQKAAAEAKLQSQFTEKEKQLNDLLGEGKRLSEYSGRQANEIRKLKQQLGQLDVVTGARDSAMEELLQAHQQLQEQEGANELLKEDLEKADRRTEQLQMELDNSQAHAHNLEKQFAEQVAKMEAMSVEMRRMEKSVQAANRERDELAAENRKLSTKLMNRKAQRRMEDERERGLEEDLKMERAKLGVAEARIRELEQRVESLQDAQRDIAVEISNANSPLLHTISGLEEKLFELEREKDTLARSLRQSGEQLAEQKRRQELEMEAMARNLEEERQNSGQKTEELAKTFGERAEIQSRLKRLEEEWAQSQKGQAARVARLEQRTGQLEEEIKAKRDELTELQRKNCELQQKVITATMEKQRNQNSTNPLLLMSPVDQKVEEGEEAKGGMRRGAGGGGGRENQGKEWAMAMARQQQQQQKPRMPTGGTNSPSPSQSGRVEGAGRGQNSPNYSLLDATTADHLRSELDAAHAQLFQLHERFENLLEMYGGCLETIEEVKEDNEDLRKLCKEQALRLAELHSGPGSALSVSEMEEEEK